MVQGKRKAASLYQDGKTVVYLADQPATVGHVMVASRQHLPIFEALSDDEINHLAKITNSTSIAVFEAIKCEGTNILIHNGMDAGQEDPHFSLNIIARRSGDGLNFEWTPKQLGEEEMATVELQMKDELSKRREEPKEEEENKPEQAEKKEEEGKEATAENKEEKTEEKEENYLIKQLKRMP
jgi:diadenosine tetraphosphate (Ap4A) HIT family hydrolase